MCVQSSIRPCRVLLLCSVQWLFNICISPFKALVKGHYFPLQATLFVFCCCHNALVCQTLQYIVFFFLFLQKQFSHSCRAGEESSSPQKQQGLFKVSNTFSSSPVFALWSCPYRIIACCYWSVAVALHFKNSKDWQGYYLVYPLNAWGNFIYVIRLENACSTAYHCFLHCTNGSCRLSIIGKKTKWSINL